MKTTVALTTIQSPTACVEEWGHLKPGEVIAVGDRKTPADWHCPGVRFFGIEEQEKSNFQLARILPENHYCRKMLGYLLALENGAEVLFDTDDDNEPYPEAWCDGPPVPSSAESVLFAGSPDCGFVNPYSFYAPKGVRVWPRGLPLEKIRSSEANLAELSSSASEPLGEKAAKVAVWQGLVDGDPDVDAIHRFVFGAEFSFQKKEALILNSGTYSPFNSQNTAWVNKAAFPLLYLPTTVTFRYTDILRSYVALVIMEKLNLLLGFTESTARQNRNEHDLMADFRSEIPMYSTVDSVIESLRATTSKEFSPRDNLLACYRRLEADGVTTPEELPRVEAWLADLSVLGHS